MGGGNVEVVRCGWRGEDPPPTCRQGSESGGTAELTALTDCSMPLPLHKQETGSELPLPSD